LRSWSGFGDFRSRFDETDPNAIALVAKELGITGTQLKTWRLEIEAFGSVEAKRRQQADAAELVRLRKDNKRLAEEVEILHKASAFFATRAVKPSLSGHCFAMPCRAMDEQARFRHCP
jgi:transposase